MRSQKDYANSKPATLDLPYGGFKNESQPGAKDGTDIVAEHMQDIQYPLYQVLQLAGIVPNGELEDGKDKRQFLQSLVNVGLMKYAQGISYASSILVWDIVGGILTVYKSAKNNNTDDISNSDSWIKILSIEKNNKINFYVNTNISSGGNNLPVFCFNAGLVDAAGKAACVTLNGNTLTLLEGSVGTSADNTTYTVAADVSIDISGLAEGTYNLFYDAEEGVLEAYANTIFVSEVEPEMTINDVWVDTSILPYSSKMKNSSGELDAREIIPLPAKLEITSVSAGGGGAILMPENYNNNRDLMLVLAKDLGSWTYKSLLLCNEQMTTVLNKETDLEFDLSSYLPNDGQRYEIIVNGYIFCGPTLASSLVVFARNSQGFATNICGIRNLVQQSAITNSALSQGSALMVVEPDRALTLRYYATGSNGQLRNFNLKGYRKVR